MTKQDILDGLEALRDLLNSSGKMQVDSLKAGVLALVEPVIESPGKEKGESEEQGSSEHEDSKESEDVEDAEALEKLPDHDSAKRHVAKKAAHHIPHKQKR